MSQPKRPKTIGIKRQITSTDTAHLMHLAEIKVFDIIGNNIAPNLPVRSSNDYNTTPSSGAIGGVFDSIKSTSVSNVGTVEWVEINLPEPHDGVNKIKKVEVRDKKISGRRLTGAMFYVIYDNGDTMETSLFTTNDSVYGFEF